MEKLNSDKSLDNLKGFRIDNLTQMRQVLGGLLDGGTDTTATANGTSCSDSSGIGFDDSQELKQHETQHASY